jgi:hypothetical protein
MSPHDITTQNNNIVIFTSVRTSNHTYLKVVSEFHFGVYWFNIPLTFMNLKSEFIIFVKNGFCAYNFCMTQNINLVNMCNFYLKHF